MTVRSDKLPGPLHKGWPGSINWIALVLILAGVALRLRAYAAPQSLWWDEAMLAENVISRSFSQLFTTLDFHQAAPPGWLILEKTAVVTMGTSEFSLRLIPFIVSIASVPLFWLLARRCLPAVAALVGLGLFALSHDAGVFAAEVKQYSFDLFAGILVLLVVGRALRNGLSTPPH